MKKKYRFRNVTMRGSASNKVLWLVLIALCVYGLVLRLSSNRNTESISSSRQSSSVSPTPKQKLQKALYVSSIDYKVTERTSGYWKYSWKAHIVNESDKQLTAHMQVNFLDSEGYVIDFDYESYITVPAHSTTPVSDYRLVSLELAPNVASAQAVLE